MLTESSPRGGVNPRALRSYMSGHVLTVSAIAARAMALLMNALVARLVGTSNYGAAGAALAIGYLASVPLAGVQWAVTRQISTADRDHYTLIRLCVVVYVVATGVFIAGIAGSHAVDEILHLHGAWPSTLLGLFLAAVLIESVPMGVLIGEKRFRYVSICLLGGALLKLVISVIWGAVHPDPIGPLAGSGISEILTAAALTGPLIPRIVRGRGANHISFKEVWLAVSGSTATLAVASIDTVAARHWLRGSDSGLYAAASAIASIAFFLPYAAIGARYADVSRGAVEGQSRAFWHGLAEVSALAAASCAVLVVSAHLITGLVFGGGRYYGACGPLRVLSVSYALMGVLFYLINHLLAHRSRAISLSWVGTAILIVLVCVRHDSTVVVASDALIATGTTFLLILSVSLRLERRIHGV